MSNQDGTNSQIWQFRVVNSESYQETLKARILVGHKSWNFKAIRVQRKREDLEQQKQKHATIPCAADSVCPWKMHEIQDPRHLTTRFSSAIY